MRSRLLPPQLPSVPLQEGEEQLELPHIWSSWNTLLLGSVLASSSGTVMALLLSTSDRWDTLVDRPLYVLLLSSSLLVGIANWIRLRQVGLITQWMLMGCALWLLMKLVLMLTLIEEPQVLLRELTESLIWLPTMLGWGLMTSISLKTPQLLRLTVLLFFAVCLIGGMSWTTRHGWQPEAVQGLFQLMLSTATGYLGMEHFMKRVEQVRYDQGEREALSRLAYTDLLTGLPNRLQLQHELERRIAAAQAFAVMFVDVDSFKVINDTLGHEAGDDLLQQVADTLQSSVSRKGDQTFRLSGDEFVVLLNDRTEVQATEIAQGWLSALQRNPDTQRGAVTSLSIGISLFPDDAITAEELLRHADSAMYAVKRSGRGQVRRYQSEYDAQTERFQQLARALNRPIGEAGFTLAYQPIYHLATRQLVKVETLLRWRHPELGQVSPAEFVPIAERTGQINQIGQWVLEEACRAAVAWPQLMLSVNVSPVQLIRADYAAQVEATLQATGFPAARLELELTETAVLHEDPRIQVNLDALHQMGIGISLDDFGAGYSNLSRLRVLRLTGVKLDRSLIENLPNEQGGFSHLLTQAAVLLARHQNLPVTAEGLETTVHVEIAQQLGCTLGQGYALSYPLTGAQLTALLKELRSPVAG